MGAERRDDRRRRAAREGDRKGDHERDHRGEPPAQRRAQPRKLSGADRSRLDKSSSLFRIVSPAQPNELFFNENAGHPAANPGVRKALVQALNLNQIGTVVTSGRGLKMTQLSLQNFTPCAGNSVAGSVPAYNPSAAHSPRSRRGRQHQGPSTRPMPAPASAPPGGRAVQQQLSAAGVKVTLDGKSTATLQGRSSAPATGTSC